MILKAGETMLLLRYTNYRATDFINEHIKCLRSNGYVWMLKTGKRLLPDRIKKIINVSGIILLRAPKMAGGSYYAIKVEAVYNGGHPDEKSYPLYYTNLVNDESMWMIDSLDGTWFKATCIEKISPSDINSIRLVSNGKLIEDVVASTRTATMYVYSDKDIETIDIR